MSRLCTYPLFPDGREWRHYVPMPQPQTIAGEPGTCSRLLSVKPNEWMHMSALYTCMHREWLSMQNLLAKFHWHFLLKSEMIGAPES